MIDKRLAAPRFLGYTDDTEMMISLAESLLSMRRFDPARFVETLRQNYEPARGYGRGMKLFFQALAAGRDPSESARAAWPSGSEGNGAAARVAPIACVLAEDARRLVEVSGQSASTTHAHPNGIAGGVV